MISVRISDLRFVSLLTVNDFESTKEYSAKGHIKAMVSQIKAITVVDSLVKTQSSIFV